MVGRFKIDSRTTPSGRRLTTGGIVVIGNDQNYSPGTGMGPSYIFGGELFKMNLFSKELSSSEVQEMSQHKCSDVERAYGDTRTIKWENIIFTSGLYFVLRAVPARPQYSPLTYSPRKIQPASRRHLI